jgi:tRNA threonylcarbamoyladenosine biosynthesis protein TsaE
MSDDFTLDLADEAATLAFGAALAAVIEPNITVFMQGNLGAGKTTMVRGLLRGLGFEGKVKSPTYTLLQTYELDNNKNIENGLKLCINHFDLYRFNDEEEWEEAGFRDAFNAQSICLIEWPEKAINCLGQADFEIHLSIPVDSTSELVGRNVTLKALSPIGRTICHNMESHYQ